ncbi:MULTISPECIES: GNAT family N-acetyltransferase [unclassified Microbacterium]|uniref:GNAT family N-acetyltransferase n=1 Tax=unclassified Microbacterium TaxID=2609290 RepID=UPI001604A62A|nr:MULTISPECIES: GNAT family N-acetyltransferase [unclassified Microbacterium]QNA93817.1 GNAT family N-acetyltransferase [Microbacterium sp. Se63.02b]QYM64112.1 GNAT family N-acetyltransferase [Microbacterium sp. Se5.02b]
MNLQVRRATPDDLSGVLEVFLACWRESYRGVLPDAAVEAMTDERAETLWRRVLTSSDGTVLVAERDGVIVGITRYASTDGAEGGIDGAVHSLYVSPRAHGGGIGGALLSRATEALREVGAGAATLWVFAANLPSIGFYEAKGWHPDGATRTQPEFGEPEQRMRKEWA